MLLFMYLIHLFSFDFTVVVYFPSEQDSFNFLRCILYWSELKLITKQWSRLAWKNSNFVRSRQIETNNLWSMSSWTCEIYNMFSWSLFANVEIFMQNIKDMKHRLRSNECLIKYSTWLFYFHTSWDLTRINPGGGHKKPGFIMLCGWR